MSLQIIRVHILAIILRLERLLNLHTHLQLNLFLLKDHRHLHTVYQDLHQLLNLHPQQLVHLVI
uniref:Uncharacterized protein n=1 Tax=Tetranychus urticae TaxID=32264 RepID=T1JTJ7_TETUR